MTSHSYSCVFSFPAMLCYAVSAARTFTLSLHHLFLSRGKIRLTMHILYFTAQCSSRPVPGHASRISPISDRLFPFSSRSDRFCANVPLLQRKIIKADIHIDFLLDSRYPSAVRILPDFKIIREINIRGICREPLRIRFDPCDVEHQYKRF